MTKWWARATAAVTGAVLTLVIPAYAWAASNGTAELAVEAARYRRRGSFGLFGVIGLVCCLVVVGGAVAAFIVISRKRKRQ